MSLAFPLELNEEVFGIDAQIPVKDSVLCLSDYYEDRRKTLSFTGEDESVRHMKGVGQRSSSMFACP